MGSVIKSTVWFVFLSVVQPTPARAVQCPIRESDYLHVRAGDDSIRAAIDEGLRTSPTFGNLVAAISKSNVIVHVENGECRRFAADACTLFVTAIGGVRYLRIRVREALPMPVLLQTLGHELQHAVEIAQATSVTDQASLHDFYRQVGTKRQAIALAFETSRAMKTGELVRREFEQSTRAR